MFRTLPMAPIWDAVLKVQPLHSWTLSPPAPVHTSIYRVTFWPLGASSSGEKSSFCAQEGAVAHCWESPGRSAAVHCGSRCLWSGYRGAAAAEEGRKEGDGTIPSDTTLKQIGVGWASLSVTVRQVRFINYNNKEKNYMSENFMPLMWNEISQTIIPSVVKRQNKINK